MARPAHILIRLAMAAVAVACADYVRAQVDEGADTFTEPSRKVDLVPAEPGILRVLKVREGDRVEKNQLVGSLDNEVQMLALAIAESNKAARGRVESATAEHNLRKTRLARLEELRATGHATQEEVDRATADLALAEGNLLTAREQQRIDELEYKKAQALVERRNLRSPIAGVVIKIDKREGDFVGGSGTPVLTIMQLDPLVVVFAVPRAQAETLRAGQKLRLVLPETNEKATGQAEFVSPVIDGDSQTVRVKVVIPNPDGKYTSGARCTLELDAAAAKGAAE